MERYAYDVYNERAKEIAKELLNFPSETINPNTKEWYAAKFNLIDKVKDYLEFIKND